MKKIILGMLAVALVSSAALADTGRVVLQVTTSGGLMAPNMSNTIRTYVLENGDVMQTVRNRMTIHPDLLVATLSPVVMEQLLTVAEKARTGKLVDDNAGAPRCMDNPSTAYEIIRKDGKVVTFKEHAGCHNAALGNNSVDVYTLSTILDGMRSLNYIR